jgi:ketosteroid isomerase-like protein
MAGHTVRAQARPHRFGHFVSEYEMSVTKDGREIVCDGVDVFSLQDGLVARKDTYLDWVAVQRQLGELAASPA